MSVQLHHLSENLEEQHLLPQKCFLHGVTLEYSVIPRTTDRRTVRSAVRPPAKARSAKTVSCVVQDKARCEWAHTASLPERHTLPRVNCE